MSKTIQTVYYDNVAGLRSLWDQNGNFVDQCWHVYALEKVSDTETILWGYVGHDDECEEYHVFTDAADRDDLIDSVQLADRLFYPTCWVRVVEWDAQPI